MSEIDDLRTEYVTLMHAMQTGVAQEMEINDAHTPKHLRVGVNSSLIQGSCIAMLLIEKGVFTELEYCAVEYMRAEVTFYEERLSDAMGITVHLL